MRLSYQIILALLVGTTSLYCGIINFYAPSVILSSIYHVDISIYSKEVRLAIESQIRLLSGMWIAAGIFTFLSVRKFESNSSVIRFVLLGLSLGAIGELISIVALEGDLQSAIIKTSIQIAIYISMELWRILITKNRTRKQ